MPLTFGFKFNILHKLRVYLVLISVLPLLIFAISSYDLVRRTILDLTAQYSLHLIEHNRDYLQQQLDQVQSLAARIASIEEIGNIAAKVKTAEENNAYVELTAQAKIREALNIYSNLKGLNSIDFFTLQGNRFYVGDTLTAPPVSDQMRSTLYEAALASDKQLRWMGVENNINTASTSRKVLTALKIIRHFSPEDQISKPVGMLVINYSTDYLYDYFSRTDLGKDAYIIVTDAQGRMVYTPERAKIGEKISPALEQILNSGSGSHLLSLNGKTHLVTHTSLRSEPWQVIGIIPQETLLAPMKRMMQMVIALILVCALVIAITTRYFRRSMVTPIQAISDGFQRMQQRQQVDPLPIPSTKDEISELVVWFNTFLEARSLRLQHEKELQESQYKFSSIFQQAPMPLSLVQLNGVLADVNDFWQVQFGFTREEAVGHTASELNIWVDFDERTRMNAQSGESGIVHQFEVRHRTKDGRILICLLSSRPIFIQGQKLLIISPVDITAQREAEQAIRDINQQLESRVLSRTLKLEQANSELNQTLETLNLAQGELVRAEKMAALGSLVAGIAHEVNTPVGVIVTGASVLNEASEAISEDVAQGKIRKSDIVTYLQTALESSRLILSNANRAAHLIQSFKQVAVDQTSEQQREFELTDFMRGLITSLNPTLRKARTTIVLNSAQEIVMDSCPGLLAQVMTNLTMNAVIHAFAEDQEGVITISLSLANEQVTICFEDDGTGIPEQYLAKIFDPFFTTRRGQGGTGLGLNIVFNIVTKQFGGVVTAHNKHNKGAMFKIVIPRVTEAIVRQA